MKDDQARARRPESAIKQNQESDAELEAYRHFDFWDFPTDAREGWREADLPAEEVYQTRDPAERLSKRPSARPQVRVSTGERESIEPLAPNVDPPTPVCLPPPPPVPLGVDAAESFGLPVLDEEAISELDNTPVAPSAVLEAARRESTVHAETQPAAWVINRRAQRARYAVVGIALGAAALILVAALITRKPASAGYAEQAAQGRESPAAPQPANARTDSVRAVPEPESQRAEAASTARAPSSEPAPSEPGARETQPVNKVRNTRREPAEPVRRARARTAPRNPDSRTAPAIDIEAPVLPE